MRFRSQQPPPPLITKIEITPIVAVALVLVLILLVTAPLLSVADLPLNLPKAKTREADHERNVSISYSVHGEVAVDDQIISPPELKQVLAARLAEPGNEDVLVIVRADSQASYAEIQHLLREARAAGAKRLAIATRQRANGETR
jgi:biopolymer transport protein ExbD